MDMPFDVQGLDAPICLLRWSRDGKQLVAAQADGRLRFFSLQA
jgi:WD40 repeat protein